MEALESLNLRVDQNEQLRIISAETEAGSREMSSKISNLLNKTEDLQSRLKKLEKLLENLVEQGAKTRTVRISANIHKLINTST